MIGVTTGHGVVFYFNALDRVKDCDSFFFFGWVKVGVGFPCHVHIGMAQAAGDLFYVDPGVAEQTCV